MKPWTLLSRRFLYFKSVVRVLSPLSILLASYSCEAVPPPKVVEEVSVRTAMLKTDSSTELLTNIESCDDEHLQISFTMSSLVGQHYVRFLNPRKGPSPLKITIDESDYSLNHRIIFTDSEIDKLCSLTKDKKAEVKLTTADSFLRIKSSLAAITPFCSLSVTKHSISKAGAGQFKCSMVEIGPVNAMAKVKESEKQLIRFRSRHPYILARRIAIARKLTESLASFDENVPARLCQLQEASTRPELPLPLNSKNWQDVWCKERYKTEELKTILKAHLHEALSELGFLLQAFKNTKTGVLTLRIPKAETDRRDFWVKLEPIQIEGLPTFENQHCYWHPFYQSAQNRIFRRLHSPELVSNTASCEKPPQDAVNRLASYYTGSVSSETEFPLSNGRGKILALPRGSYRYSLHPTENPYDKPDISHDQKFLGNGTIEWRSRKPYPVIRSRGKLSQR